MTEPSVDDVANAMFELVKSTHGKKNLKARVSLTNLLHRLQECRQNLLDFPDTTPGKKAEHQVFCLQS